MNTKNIIEYLKSVYELEKVRYTLNTLYNEINNSINNMNTRKNRLLDLNQSFLKIQPEEQYAEVSTGSIIIKIIGLGIAGFLIGDILTLPIINLLVPNLPYPFLFLFIGAIIGGIWGKYEENEYTSYHNKAVNEKNIKIRQDNQRISSAITSNSNEIKVIEHKLPLLHYELKKIDQQCYVVEDTLRKYYDMNVLFKKYHFDFIAISSFYEYFLSGRTTRLTVSETGADIGAYNLFENELRQNVIIGQLNEIIQRLDQIQQNQRMLYDAISECNQNIQSFSRELQSTTSNMQSTLNSINQNTRLSAFYSGVAAINSQYLKRADIIRTYFK